MGTYTTSDKKFNLILSFRYAVGASELSQWKDSFQKASELLYAATDGQQQLGKLYVCNDSTGGTNADIWLYNTPVAEGTNSTAARIWLPFQHADFENDEQWRPFVIVHELGHYLYDLGDEYSKLVGGKPVKGAHCIGEPPSGSKPSACIMERDWRDGDRWGPYGFVFPGEKLGSFIMGTTTDFCVALNHDLGQDPLPLGLGTIRWDDVKHDTIQSTRHSNKSCWETMISRYSDLTPPGTVTSPAPSSLIDWIELTADLRFVLAIDRSGSMGDHGGRPIQEAIIGASAWSDAARVDDFLGVVAFDDRIEKFPDSGPPPKTLTKGDRSAVSAFIGGLTARGSTAMGDALRQAMNMIDGAGDQSATQVIVLFSDGVHNTGEDPLAVLPTVVEKGIRVYTLGFGPFADVARLTAIAEGSGGKFYPINPALELGESEKAIRDTLITLSTEVRDGGGIVTADAAVIDSGAGVSHKVLIDEGCLVATFVVSWEAGSAPLTMELKPPGEPLIDAASTAANVRHSYRGLPFRIFQIKQPTPGEWQYRVKFSEADEQEHPRGAVPYTHYVFAEGENVQFAISSPRRHYVVGEPIQILGQVAADRTVTGLPVTGTVAWPNGGKAEVELFDNGDSKAGSEIAESGRYSAIFIPQAEGLHTFTIVADNSELSAVPAVHGDVERTVEDDPALKGVEPFEPPAFVRQTSLTVLVGKPRVRGGTATPSVFDQSSSCQLQLDLQHIPWVAGVSQLSAGPGIDLVEDPVESVRVGRPTFSIGVGETAQTGFRDLTVIVGADRYRLEGAIEIRGEDQPLPEPDEDRMTRPGFLLRKRLKDEPLSPELAQIHRPLRSRLPALPALDDRRV